MWNDRRWRTVLLALSLLLNVFLLGVVAGRLGGRPPLATAPKRADLPVVPLVNLKTIPAEQRKLFRATMASHREAIRALRQETRRLKLAAEGDIAAEPFDAAKVTADFSALREAGMAVQTAVNTALVEALGKLSPSSRAALVNGEFREPAPTK